MITILTRPIRPPLLRALKDTVQGRWERLRDASAPKRRKYGGHYAVTRSACEGLGQLGVSFNVDPKSVKTIGKTVVALADPRSLVQAIDWKRRGRINRLLAGHTILNTPAACNGLARSSEIDCFLMASQWSLDWWEILSPGFASKAVVWPVGVDADFWAPPNTKGDSRHILFYRKRAPRRLYEQCLSFARAQGFFVEEIVYSSYTIGNYREALHRNSLVVTWTDHEPEGIFFLEAWAANRPTLVWDPGAVFVAENAAVADSFASPYLSDHTGKIFRDFEGFVCLLQALKTSPLSITPRAWLLEHMTDEVCAKRLLVVIDSIR